jgi:hypothetical protein
MAVLMEAGFAVHTGDAATARWGLEWRFASRFNLLLSMPFYPAFHHQLFRVESTSA